MNEHNSIKLKILKILNEFRISDGQFACKDLREVANTLSIDFDKFIKLYVSELDTESCILMDAAAYASIEPKGISIVEQDSPFYDEYRNPELKNININAPVTNSNIIQGNDNSIKITNQYFDYIIKEIEKSNLQPPEKTKWLKRIKDISSHPIVSQMFLKGLDFLSET